MKKQNQHSSRTSIRIAMIVTLAAAGFLAVPAMAQAGPFGRGDKGCSRGGKGGKGMGVGMGMGMGMGKLMFGDLNRLQKHLKLTPGQVGQIKKLRAANKGKRVKVQLEMARIHAQMRVEWLTDKPSVWKLKKLHLQKLKLKSNLANERFWVRIKVAQILTPTQRLQLKRGGRGFGRHGMRGGGRGFGRGGMRGGGRGFGRGGGRGDRRGGMRGNF